jgi:hypothetical protein
VVFFLLIVLAWGEGHRTYGNFVFVRLFEGKGLLIALTTPITVIAGLMLLRHPSVWNWAFLVLAHAAAIGVSSSGLVCAFGTTALIMIASAGRNMRAFAVSAALVGSTLFYPAVLGVWLKFLATGLVSLREIGTFAPINTSLGLGGREGLALAMLVLGAGALGSSVQRREYLLLVSALLLVVFNPWLSELLSRLSAQNVSWRLAWAAPVPLLLAVGTASIIAPVSGPKTGTWQTPYRGTVAGMAALLIFLCAGPWTLAKSNNIGWRWPSPKLPAVYASTKEIAMVLKSRGSQGTVLADRRVATWLPLLTPDVGLVMPGHTYPAMLQTVLPPSEFADRMLLFGAINGEKVDVNHMVELIRYYRVTTLVLKKDSIDKPTIVDAIQTCTGIRAEEIGVVAGYRIVTLVADHTSP